MSGRDSGEEVKPLRVKITREGLRETGSTGTAVDAGAGLWFVTLDRDAAPYRGHYTDMDFEVLP